MNPDQIPLRDIHLPSGIGWWPLAPGWWVVLAIVAIAAGWLLYRAWLDWRAGRARRAALRQLSALDTAYRETGDVVALGKQLSELLRRAMLAYAPRREVAGLTGNRWLEMLDSGLDERPFSDGPGQSLEVLPYRDPGLAAEGVDVDGLLDAVRQRLKTPLPRGTA
jgi:hypothetical protein